MAVGWCLCGHDLTDHAMTWARCRGIDSYGITCTCKRVELDTDEDLNADEPEPDADHIDRRAFRRQDEVMTAEATADYYAEIAQETAR